MTSTSKIPAVIDAIFAIANASLDPSKVIVFDGPTRGTVPQRYMTIGFSPSQTSAGAAVVESTDTFQGVVVDRMRESFDVHCQVSSFSGAGDFKTVRDEVFSYLDALAVGIEQDPTLGGVALEAHLAVAAYLPAVGSGPTVTVDFQIHVETMRG